MRIGLFTDFYAPSQGGVETAVTTYAQALQLLGHEVSIVCPAYPSATESESGVIRLSTRDYLVSHDQPIVTLSKQNKLLVAEQQFDIVHTHTEGTTALLGAWYATQHAVPLFETFHSVGVAWWRLNRSTPVIFIDCWFLRGWFMRQAKSLGLTRSVQLAHKPTPHYESWIWKNILIVAPYLERMLVPSQHFMEELQQYYPSNKYMVLPNAVEVAKFKPQFSPANSQVRILWVSRATLEKRPLEFLKAIRLLKNKTDITFSVDMLGGGSELPAMRQFVEQHQLAEVTIHGGQSLEQTRQFYNKADLFVLSSVDFDNQPMVLAEASASGLPVVLSDKRLANQLLTSACFVAQTPSAEDLAVTIKSALRKKTPQTAKPIVDFAMSHYDLKVLGVRLDKLYKEAVA